MPVLLVWIEEHQMALVVQKRDHQMTLHLAQALYCFLKLESGLIEVSVSFDPHASLQSPCLTIEVVSCRCHSKFHAQLEHLIRFGFAQHRELDESIVHEDS